MIEIFRELNQELYNDAKPSPGLSYYRRKLSGTEKEKRRRKVQGSAHGSIEYAVRKGDVIKPDECQTCGRKRELVAHHWHGYNHPLDVWWVCRPCNKFLRAHDGSLTIEQAKDLMAQRYQF